MTSVCLFMTAYLCLSACDPLYVSACGHLFLTISLFACCLVRCNVTLRAEPLSIPQPLFCQPHPPAIPSFLLLPGTVLSLPGAGSISWWEGDSALLWGLSRCCFLSMGDTRASKGDNGTPVDPQELMLGAPLMR